LDVGFELLEKARLSLKRADLMSGAGDGEAARRECYFAAFHAARALLFVRTGLFERAHDRVRLSFGRYAVSFGLPPELARFLASAHRYMELADYEIGAPPRDQGAAAALRAAGEFVRAIEAELADDR
jgi:uncharacterized protein (UPF0332 family)